MILSKALLLNHVIKRLATGHHPTIGRLRPHELPAAGAKLQAQCLKGLGIRASQVSWKTASKSLELVTIL